MEKRRGWSERGDAALRLCPEPRLRDALRAAFTPPGGASLEASRVDGEMLSKKMSLEGLSWVPLEGRGPGRCWPSAGVNWEGATEVSGILLVSAHVLCPLLPPQPIPLPRTQTCPALGSGFCAGFSPAPQKWVLSIPRAADVVCQANKHH